MLSSVIDDYQQLSNIIDVYIVVPMIFAIIYKCHCFYLHVTLLYFIHTTTYIA